MPDEKQIGPTDAEVLQGFTRVEVIHRKTKRKELVDVEILPISRLQAYAETQGNPAKCASLLTGKSDSWPDSLEMPSVFKVVEEGFRVNSTNFFALGSHHKSVLGMLRGTQTEPSPLPDGSPESVSQPE